MFNFVCKEFDEIYICIDGLDELNAEHSNQLLESLARARSSIHILITVRTHVKPVVVAHFPSAVNLMITASKEDIESHIGYSIHTCGVRWQGMKDDITEKLLKSSAGNFLFADRLIAFVLAGESENELRRRLDRLPETIEETFFDMMKRVQEGTRGELGQAILTCVSLSERPLTVEELRHALVMDKAYDESDSDDALSTHLDTKNLANKDIFRTHCLGLVVIDETDRTVRLFHQSFRDYLNTPYLKHWRHKDAQNRLARACLKYLMHPLVIKQSMTIVREDKDPNLECDTTCLLRYTSCFWGHHLRKSGQMAETVKLAMKYLSMELTKRYCSQWYFCKRLSSRF